MAYEVVVPDRVQKEVNKRLKNKELIRRFYKRIQKLEKDPTIHGKPLRKPLAGVWEVYFEKRWRVLFEIREKKVVILALTHKDEM